MRCMRGSKVVCSTFMKVDVVLRRMPFQNFSSARARGLLKLEVSYHPADLHKSSVVLIGSYYLQHLLSDDVLISV